MKKYCSIFVILIIAAFLRFHQLGQMPFGLTVDETAIAYNGYAVLTTRRDEWLNRLPISFRSFGDYKAPLAIYLNGPFTYLLGMQAWAVRLPFVLFSLLGIVFFYLLVRELFREHAEREKLALLAALLLSFSPWHLHFSRLGFEAGIAMSLTIMAVYFFYLYRRLNKWWMLLVTCLLFVSTFYAYHSNKLLTPILLLFLAWQQRFFILDKWRQILAAVILAFVLLLPFMQDALLGEGLTRMNSSTVLSQNWALTEKISVFAKSFLSYLHPDFLLFGQADENLRHSDGQFGVLTFAVVVLLVLLPFLLYLSRKTKAKQGNFVLAIMWLIAAIAPAALSGDPQHTVRSLSALPAFLLLAVSSLALLMHLKPNWQKVIFALLVSFEVVSLLTYQKHYYGVYKKTSSDAFRSGYLEAFAYLKNTNKQNIDKIVFTNDYEHAYIYALFAFRLSPIAWQGGILNIFEFSEKIDQSDLSRQRTIVVASQYDEMGERKPDQVILGSDGEVKFKIYHLP